MTILLLCGFQTTGKDFVYQNLHQGTFLDHWIVLSKNGFHHELSSLITPSYQRVAFADKLKSYVLNKYHLPDSIQKSDRIPSLQKTYRELLIEEGTLKRDIDPFCWVSEAMDPWVLSSTSICITDWRYKKEKEYIESKFDNVITARVYRSCVPVPTDKSEHILDDVLTDFVFLSSEQDIEPFMDQFQQYKDYKLIL